MLVGTLPSLAQMPPIATRAVHPCIAEPAPTVVLNGTSPLFQYQDSAWNHGEGFAATGADADQGGWFNEDDGSGLTAADIYATMAWAAWPWTDPYHPSSPQTIRRFVGHLRPANLQLPTEHPLYGSLSSTQGPFGNGRYVDQAAFEMFAPVQLPTSTEKIAVVIYNWQTVGMPADAAGNVHRWNLYQGFFSPDGLARAEQSPRSMSNFLLNLNNQGDVIRPLHVAEFVATASTAAYYPITAYAVLSMPGRQTTLNEQRNMQLRQAILLLLQQPDNRNPIYPQVLTAEDVERRVVVVFAGGSNGGHQAMWSAMRYPDRVHGAFCEVIHPSIQRLLGEHDLGFSFSRQAGLPESRATVTEWDFMNWGRYAWNQGYWIHDLSFLRRQARDQVFRPAFFRAGDEDITTTGTDWAAVANNGAWARSGQSSASIPQHWLIASKLSWSISNTARHGSVNATVDPYTGATTFYMSSITHGLVTEAIANRHTEVNTTPPPVPPSIPSETRGSQLRGLDDPHEWALGRSGTPMNPSNSMLTWDRPWFEAVQPGAAGTWLGYKEAMLVRDHRLYTVGAEGLVTAFEVDLTPGNRQRLVKVAQTHAPNQLLEPMSLGLDACALAAMDGSGGWKLVVGTRRHLYALDPGTLSVTGGPVEIPWEIAQPHHMKVADLLPTNPGAEIVFASQHGGLVFYSSTLQLLYEWPEPGIVDFVPTRENTVTILSHRGVVAEVEFEATTNPPITPRLLAASRPIPRRLQQVTQSYDPDVDSPSQGMPHDLELMRLTQGENGPIVAAVGLWTSDEDSTDGTAAVRSYAPGTLATMPFASQIGRSPFGRGGLDMATCREGSNPFVSTPFEPGDHLLVLHGDRIYLYDQQGGLLGEKHLYLLDPSTAAGNLYTPFGRQSNAIAVGDLVDNGLTGTTGLYAEEVVIATQSGALLWMHVNDIATPLVHLGPDYNLTVGSPTSNIQPRTNQSMSATWAMTQRSGDTAQLHLLDQRGGYWTVGHGGAVRLQDRDFSCVGARGWDDLGNRDLSGTAIPVSSPWNTLRLEVGRPPGQPADVITVKPWCPIKEVEVYYELTGSAYYQHNNWQRTACSGFSFQGFVVHPWGGCVLDKTTTREVWFWSAGGSWGNLLQGIEFALPGSVSSWPVTGLWASTEHRPALSGTQDKLNFHDLRSPVHGVPIMTHQAIRAFNLPSGSTALVLGCPGGRVRIVELPAGSMASPPNGGHVLGTWNSPVQTGDLGYGGGALATKQLTNGGECQRSCRLKLRNTDHAAASPAPALRGLRATDSMRSRDRQDPDHRCGFLLRAAS